MIRIAILDKATLGEGLDFMNLKAIGTVTLYENTSAKEMVEHLKHIEVAVSNKCVYTQEVMAQLPSLKLICSTGTGYNTIDLEAARRYGIGVTNVMNYCTDSVAQHTIAMVLHLRHQLGYYRSYTSSLAYVGDHGYGHYKQSFHELPGAKWGIIGMGHIGLKVAELAVTLGCSVQYYSTSGKNQHKPYDHVSLVELLTTSDIVTIHAPLNQQTTHLLNKDNLCHLKKTAILVNVGRGAIIDTQALVDHVKTCGIGGLGLDVLEEEPMLASSPLMDLIKDDHVLLTPHIAWASVEARQRVIDEVGLNIVSYSEGGQRNRVDII